MGYHLKKIDFFDLPIGTIFTWDHLDNNILFQCFYVGIKINNNLCNNAKCIDYTVKHWPPPLIDNYLTISKAHYIELPGKTVIV